MATFFGYRCSNPECKFRIDTAPSGHDYLMMGEFFKFHCPNCKKIVTLFAEEMDKHSRNQCCKDCGGELHPWNPVTGKCPKCQSALEEDKSVIIDAD